MSVHTASPNGHQCWRNTRKLPATSVAKKPTAVHYEINSKLIGGEIQAGRRSKVTTLFCKDLQRLRDEERYVDV